MSLRLSSQRMFKRRRRSHPKLMLLLLPALAYPSHSLARSPTRLLANNLSPPRPPPRLMCSALLSEHITSVWAELTSRPRWVSKHSARQAPLQGPCTTPAPEARQVLGRDLFLLHGHLPHVAVLTVLRLINAFGFTVTHRLMDVAPTCLLFWLWDLYSHILLQSMHLAVQVHYMYMQINTFSH